MEQGTKTTRQIPIVAIRGSIVFPHTDAVLSFGRKKSIAAINTAFQEDRVIGVFTQKEAKIPDPGVEDLFHIGTIATISQMMSTEGEVHAVVKGQARIKLLNISSHEPYLIGYVEELPEEKDESADTSAPANKVKELFKKAINLGKQAEIMTVMKLVSGKVEPPELADQVASLLDLKTKKKQELLENPSLKGRLEKVLHYLAHEVNVLELERTISSKTQKRFEDQMRKAMLREKKRTIEEELGEGEEGDLSSEERSEYKDKIKKAGMPKDVREKADKELKRLSQLSPHNPEGGYIRNYLDWLTDMPWSKESPNNVSIKHARDVLDNDHYGLKKAKERILEFLAVMKVKNEKVKAKPKKKDGSDEDKFMLSQPTILCFMGPPGVGKTSIGKSIAKALGREFVRISLGGIRDEAEIRGHRRTYVGALPGRIIQGIKNAGTRNPVFMLDEIDKLGVDFRGDPSSALLEALDPEQNNQFSDHYLEVPFDLSQVMFVATANMLDTIPPALRDRLEIITFPGYTLEEKLNIAQNYLWSKQVQGAGLPKSLKIANEAVREIIRRYTREAGVRDVETNLAKIARKLARGLAEKKKISHSLGLTDVKKYLGQYRFPETLAEKQDEVGMSTGLAWTEVGGDILFIEVALMPGKGELKLTGQLGDVMKESAQAAYSYIRSRWQKLGLKDDFYKKIDVHLHVPEGATPKDGPSAGIALTTALISAFTKIPVRRDTAMTGEITLRGRVLEIGGVKEKIIAAHRAGIKRVILPKDNRKDLEDVPPIVKREVKFQFVSHLDDVLKVALRSATSVKLPKSTPRFLTATA